ncbi:MAG: hypothetical protein M1514_00880 [Patescibacteria group bacterium]|nr:hypothetical protein [Patescibacteria group bacterium]
MFTNRLEAGKKLGSKLAEELSSEVMSRAVILGIPRGGVLVGKGIIKSLSLPFDCLVVKKIHTPGNEDLTIGAVGEGGVVVWEEKQRIDITNREEKLVAKLQIPLDYRQEVVKKKVEEFEKKEGDFRQGKPTPDLKGKVVIIADDGVLSGATMKAAVAVVRNFNPQEVIAAVPVLSQEKLEEVKEKVDRVIYLEAPEMVLSIQEFYQDFSQPTDEEILELLK